jgi:hypothetical protein
MVPLHQPSKWGSKLPFSNPSVCTNCRRMPVDVLMCTFCLHATPDHNKNATFRFVVLNECSFPGETQRLVLSTSELLPGSKNPGTKLKPVSSIPSSDLAWIACVTHTHLVPRNETSRSEIPTSDLAWQGARRRIRNGSKGYRLLDVSRVESSLLVDGLNNEKSHI